MRTPLQKGEKILLVTYSSWTSLFLPFFIGLAGCVASYFIGFIQHWGWIAAVLGVGYTAIKYYTWKAYIWVVTNFRVIDEAGLFSHFAKESPLDKINNVSYDQTVMGRLFNFGHVKIQTAAQVGATDYYNVNNPKRLKDTITSAQSAFQELQLGNQAFHLANAFNAPSSTAGNSGHVSNNPPAIAAELEKLFDLKQKGALSEDEYNRAKSRLLGH